MPSETVQIGNFVFSRILLDLAIPMLSVLLGGLITYLTTRSLEQHRWQIEQKAELVKRKREALGQALGWADIVDRDVTKAVLLAGNFIEGMISEEEFRQGWPDLLSKLAAKDLSPRLSVLLPDDAYQMGLRIVRNLHDLYILGLRAHGAKSMSAEKWTEFHSKYLNLSTVLYDHVETFRKSLREGVSQLCRGVKRPGG